MFNINLIQNKSQLDFGFYECESEDSDLTSEDEKEKCDGCFCVKCKNFFPYAIPNQDDGITMICWSCRSNF